MATRLLYDLTGQRFGKLTALEYDKSQTKWKCVCDCGKTVYVTSGNLRDGSVKSCGCDRLDLSKMVGKKYGEWTVLSYDGSGKVTAQCSCGNKRQISAYALRNGNTTMCKACSYEKRFPSLVGQRFGHWTVIDNYKLHGVEDFGKTGKYYLCRCDCGTVRPVLSRSLRQGISKSCGCCRRRKESK